MNLIEETIDATLDSNGQLTLTHQPRLLPGPRVRVTIRVAAGQQGHNAVLADVIREIAADQRSRGFPGRSADDVSSGKRRESLLRTPSGIGNWTLHAAGPRQGDRECSTTWTPSSLPTLSKATLPINNVR